MDVDPLPVLIASVAAEAANQVAAPADEKNPAPP